MLTHWKSQGTCTERLIEETKCLQPLQVDPDNGVSMDILKEDMDELVSAFFFFCHFFPFQVYNGIYYGFWLEFLRILMITKKFISEHNLSNV